MVKGIKHVSEARNPGLLTGAECLAMHQGVRTDIQSQMFSIIPGMPGNWQFADNSYYNSFSLLIAKW